METEVTEITINGKVYIPKDDASLAKSIDGMPYVIVRTYSAGVFAGYLKSSEGQEAVMVNARRLWYWSGAASLSQLAMEGVKNPKDCKFPCEVTEVKLTQVVEMLKCTEKARKNIAEVWIWKS